MAPTSLEPSRRLWLQVRHWKAGKPLIFDDMIAHEADDGDEDRVILILMSWAGTGER